MMRMPSQAPEVKRALLNVVPPLTLGVARVPITPFMSRTGPRDCIFASYALIGDDVPGFGYVQHMTEAQAREVLRVAERLLERGTLQLAHLLDIERWEQSMSGAESSASTRAAACAISIAAWDFFGRRLGAPCAALWGGSTEPLPCYSSFHIAFASEGELERAARRCLAENFAAAKLAVGSRSLDEDLARVRTAARILGPGRLAIDALQRWSVQQLHEVIEKVQMPLLWIEDPVPYADLDQPASPHPIAAGETCSHSHELVRLASAGVSCLLIDMGMVGGPLRQLELSRTLGAMGATIGSHAYPYYSTHVLACIPDPLPVEVLDWGDRLFRAVPRPDESGRLPVQGPGFGVEVDLDLLEQWSVARVRKRCDA